MKPKTGAQRQAAYTAKGRQIAVVLTDEKAIATLERLAEQHGGIKAAVTHALHAVALKTKA
jgi:tryptophan synthase beta subunit